MRLEWGSTCTKKFVKYSLWTTMRISPSPSPCGVASSSACFFLNFYVDQGHLVIVYICGSRDGINSSKIELSKRNRSLAA